MDGLVGWMLKGLLEETINLKQMIDRTPTDTANDQRSQFNCRGRIAIFVTLTGDKKLTLSEPGLFDKAEPQEQKVTLHHAQTME